MPQSIVILIGGYALIVISFAWIWAICYVASWHDPARRVEAPTRGDLKALLGISAFWTLAWTVIVAAGSGKEPHMWLAMAVLGVICFAALAAFAWACERL